MRDVDVLVPTYNRLESLILVLAGLAAQTILPTARIVVAEQSDRSGRDHPVVQTARRLVEAHGGIVDWHCRPQVHGIAEQRDYLLRQAAADAVLYLDDD